MTQYTKHELQQQLHNGVLTVVFVKTDGNERTMKCTLQADYLPERTEAQLLQEERVPNPEVVNVWDVDANGWRSFRVDSIVSVG